LLLLYSHDLRFGQSRRRALVGQEGTSATHRSAVRRADGEEWLNSDEQLRAFYENLSKKGQRLYEPVVFAHPPCSRSAVIEPAALCGCTSRVASWPSSVTTYRKPLD
jgi:hypothetical protein